MQFAIMGARNFGSTRASYHRKDDWHDTGTDSKRNNSNQLKTTERKIGEISNIIIDQPPFSTSINDLVSLFLSAPDLSDSEPAQSNNSEKRSARNEGSLDVRRNKEENVQQ